MIKNNRRVVYLPYTEGRSSTMLREALKKFYKEQQKAAEKWPPLSDADYLKNNTIKKNKQEKGINYADSQGNAESLSATESRSAKGVKIL